MFAPASPAWQTRRNTTVVIDVAEALPASVQPVGVENVVDVTPIEATKMSVSPTAAVAGTVALNDCPAADGVNEPDVISRNDTGPAPSYSGGSGDRDGDRACSERDRRGGDGGGQLTADLVGAEGRG